MANAWIIRPLPMTLTSPFGATVGQIGYLGNDYMGVRWGNAGTLSNGQYVYLVDADLGSDQPVDTILGLGIAGIPFGSTFQIYANTQAQGPLVNMVGFASPLFDRSAGTAELPGGVLTFQWSAPLLGSPPPSRYWRVLLYSPAQFTFQFSRLILGKRIMPGRNFSHGAAFGVRDLGSVDFSRRGVLLRSRGRKLRTLGLTFASLYRDEVEAMIQPLLEMVGGTEALAIITDPMIDIQTSRRTYFGMLNGDIGAILLRGGRYQVAMNLTSLI